MDTIKIKSFESALVSRIDLIAVLVLLLLFLGGIVNLDIQLASIVAILTGIVLVLAGNLYNKRNSQQRSSFRLALLAVGIGLAATSIACIISIAFKMY